MNAQAERRTAIWRTVSKARVWLVGGLILAAYSAIFITLPRGVFYSPDAGGKYLQMLGYRWENGLRCDIVYSGAEMDPDGCFYGAHAERAAFTAIHPYRDEAGGTHVGWTPWFSLLARPFFRAFGLVGLYAVPWMAGLGLIAWAGRIAERLRPGLGALTAAVVGLATPVLFYSMCFWEHTLATLLALAGLWPWIRAGSGPEIGSIRPFEGWIGGALLLAACAVRRELIIFSGAGLLAWCWIHPRWRSHFPAMVVALLGAGTGGILLLLFHPAALLWLFPSGVNHVHWLSRFLHADMWRGIGPNGIRFLLLNDSDGLLPPSIRWTGVAGLVSCLGSPFAPVRWRRGMVLVGTALASVPAAWLVGIPVRYRALNSLMLPAPLGLLALLPSVARGSAARRGLGWTIVVFLGSFGLALPAVVGGAHGGIEWGSRYALVAMVLLNVLGMVAVAETRTAQGLSAGVRRSTEMLALWLILLGMASAGRGVQELGQTRRELLALQTELDRADCPVVTDIWWLGASLAPFATRHEFYTLSDSHPFQEWLVRIGPRRPRFTYVGKVPETGTHGDGLPWLRRRMQSAAGLPVTRFERVSDP